MISFCDFDIYNPPTADEINDLCESDAVVISGLVNNNIGMVE